MKLFKKIQKKLGILAVFGLLLQTAMPIYQNAAFAMEGNEEATQEQVVEASEEDDSDSHSDDLEATDETDEKAEALEGDGESDLDSADESKNKGNTDSESNNLEKDRIEEEKGRKFGTAEKEAISENQLAEKPKDLGDIFTFESLTKNDQAIEDGEVIDIGDEDLIQIKYLWDTGEQTVNPGDYAEIDIPDSFVLPRAIENENLLVGDDEKVGTYSIKDGKISFLFDEGIEDFGGQVHNGHIQAGAKFNLEKFQEDVVEEIKFNDKNDKRLTVIGKPSVNVEGINKQGVPNSDKDASEITWTIDITNPSDEAITEASLTDVIPDGLALDESSIKVSDLTVGLDGNLTKGDSVTVSPEVNGQNLEIPFDQIDSYKGYQIEYTTDITDKAETQFTNDANLVDGDKKLPAEATVNVERSDYIEKYGRKKGKGNIEWEIDVNKAGGSINEAIIEDELPEGLVLESIEIFDLTKDGDNWTESDSDKTATEFPVNLGKLGSVDVYRIKIETSVDYSEVNGGDYEQSTDFTNEAILKDGDEELDSDDYTVNIVRAAILSKTGSDVKIDHDEGKKLDWKVTVNEANHKIDNAVITDTLPAGLKIDKADIVVKDSKGDDVTDDATITVPSNDGSEATAVTINLGNITEKYTITYSTKVTDFNKNKFTNDASIGGTGIGPDGSTDKETTKPKGNSYTKNSTARDIDEQTISWKSTVNPHREAIEELTITDTFPQKGLFLLEDTVKIKVGSEELDKGTDFTLNPDGSYQDGFVIEFDDDVFPIREEMTITYDTSYNLKDVIPNKGDAKKRYNEVNFTGKTVNDNDIDVDKKKDVTVGETTVNSGKKVGNLVSIDENDEQVNGWHSGNERRLEWEVYTNYLQQDLGEDVVVEDVLGYNGDVDIDNLKVREYTVNKDNGNTTLGEAIDPSKYNVEATDKGFKLSFTEAVSERYAIVFTTNVPEISKGVYENTATTKVGDKEYPYTGSIKFDKANNHLSKEAIGIDGNEVYTDDEIDWEVKINESLSFVEEKVKVVDTISAGMEYKDENFELYKLEGTEEVLVDDSEYDLVVNRDTDDDTTELTINFDGSISSTYLMKYKTIVTETDGEVNNTVDFSGSNFDKKTVESEKLSAQQFSSTGGDPTRGKVQITKQDVDDEDEKLAGAEFEFYYMLNGEKQYVQADDESKTHVTNQDGILEFPGLQVNRTYFLEEITAPDGYEITNPEVIEIKDLKPVGQNNQNVHEITVENTKFVNISGTKTWLDDNSDDRPETITVQLLGDNKPAENQEVSEDVDGNWIYEFTDLSRYNEDGSEIEYTIDELEVDGYETIVDGHKLKNLRVGKTDVSGEKTWIEEDDQYRPETITVQLLANGDNLTTKDMSEETDWAYSFTDLDKYDSEGELIDYTIKELEVTGYDAVVEGYDIINTQKTTDLSGTKTWIDDNDATGDRPESIVVQVMNPTDSNPVQEQEVTANEDDNWNYTFTDLPKYDQEGNEIDYTVTEKVPEGYELTVDGNDISNLRKDETEITIDKTWKDENKSDRPDVVKVNLLQNGVLFGDPYELTKENNWKLTISDLPEFNEKGRAHNYTVTEHDVPGYESDIDRFSITNTRTDEKSINITKSWLDEGSKKRPDEIEVELFRSITDGEKESVETHTIKASEDWSLEIEELPAFDPNGKAYTYTIEEEAIKGYKSEVNGLDITNLRVGKTKINLEKHWNDDDKSDRPDVIKVNLLQNGIPFGDLYEVTKENNWKLTISDLPKFDKSGKTYKYSIAEHDVPGYDSEVNGFDISNTRSEKKDIEITKGWLDNDSDDRPESILVHVYQNDELFDTVEVKEADDWGYELTDLDAFDEDGQAYRYHIEEKEVEGYETEINGFNIKNLRTDETDLSGQKIWKDDKNALGKRPDSITINLLQNGQKIESQEITADDNWTYTFDTMAMYDEEGVLYDYTIEEENVESYESTIEGDDIINLIIGQRDLMVKKIWKNDKEENRPETTKVQLFRNSELIKTVELSKETEWTYEFKDLDKFDSEGKIYDYTIKEETVENYEAKVTETDTGFEVTNIYHIEDPEEPEKPEDPSEPQEPETPEDPTEPGDSEAPEDPDSPGLPQTGEANNTLFYILGALLILTGLGLGRKRLEE